MDIGLKTGLANDGFIAEALGNLAAFELANRRNERLEWQVLRVESSGHHHFRLIVRHPQHVLDFGLAHELDGILHELSAETVDALRQRFGEAQQSGLKAVSLRHVRETVDFWHDDFWKWIG